MTSLQVGDSKSRFRLESHDHDGNFIAQLPYKDLQGDWFPNSKGSSLRGTIPYRGYPQITQANLYPGKHELWLYDTFVSVSDPIFAGPLWDLTGTSKDGTLSFAAQDPLSYLVKILLKSFKSYVTQRTDQMIVNLIAYVNSIRTTLMTTSVVATSSQTGNKYYLGTARHRISDLIDEIAQMNDKCDYFFRTSNGAHVLNIYGGQIKPSTVLSFVGEYGGILDGYSVQLLATGIGNDVDIISRANGIISNAVSAAKKTEYDVAYQIAVDSDLVVPSELANTATQQLKDTQSTKIIPSVVTRSLVPIKDFDFGSQYKIVINDEYMQVNQVGRVAGWQTTISHSDEATVVIYNADTEGVT